MTNDCVHPKEVLFDTRDWYIDYLHKVGCISNETKNYFDKSSDMIYLEGYREQELEEYTEALANLELELGEIKFLINNKYEFIFDNYDDHQNVPPDPIWTVEGLLPLEPIQNVKKYGWRFKGDKMIYRDKEHPIKVIVGDPNKFPRLYKKCTLDEWRNNDDSAYLCTDTIQFFNRSEMKPFAIYLIKCPINCRDCWKMTEKPGKPFKLEQCIHTEFGWRLLRFDRWLDEELESKKLQFGWINTHCDGKTDAAELFELSHCQLSKIKSPAVSEMEETI